LRERAKSDKLGRLALAAVNWSRLNDDAESRANARVGSVLDDKWTLERLLGVGGMAAVYAARHRNGARGAIKLLHADLARHREVRERFLREGYAANRVDHPGAVRVLDDDIVATGPSAGTAYLVMELLIGQSMQDRLECGPPMDEREFLQIADQVLDVLCAAHARGVVHRDLKPENLFLVHPEAVAAAGAAVKVLDFGLARLLDGQAITTYGLALGTPSFMSPEQAAGRLDEIDGRTDLFALAATGFRLRSGRRIHDAGSPVELVQKMAKLAAPSLRTVAPDASEPYARVVDRALAFRREDRYPGAEAMRRDVQAALAELDASLDTTMIAGLPRATRPPPVPREPLTLEISQRDLEPSPAPAAAAKRRRRWLLPLVSLLFYGGIGARLYLDAHPGLLQSFVLRRVAAPEARGTATTAMPSAAGPDSASPRGVAPPAPPLASAEPADEGDDASGPDSGPDALPDSGPDWGPDSGPDSVIDSNPADATMLSAGSAGSSSAASSSPLPPLPPHVLPPPAPAAPPRYRTPVKTGPATVPKLGPHKTRAGAR